MLCGGAKMVFVNYILLFPVCMAHTVSVYDSLAAYEFGRQPVSVHVDEPHQFDFHSNDTLFMEILLENMQPGVYIDINSNIHTGINLNSKHDRHPFWLYHHLVNDSEITIKIKVCTGTHLCISQTIAEGRRVSTVADAATTDVCLKKGCCIVVDLSNATPEYITTNITKDKQRHSNVSSSHADVDEYKSRYHKTVTVSTTTTKLVTTTETHSTDTANAETTSSTVIITSAATAAAVVLLVVIALCTTWKRCWGKCDAPRPTQSATNDLSNRFYVNMLFRNECDAEIREREQRQYEEIELPHYEEIGQQYEEVGQQYEEVGQQYEEVRRQYEEINT